jgi:hypothetical protein
MAFVTNSNQQFNFNCHDAQWAANVGGGRRGREGAGNSSDDKGFWGMRVAGCADDEMHILLQTQTARC